MSSFSIAAWLDETEQARPTDGGIFVPFRYLFGPRANLAILLVLFALILGLTAGLAALMFALGKSDPRSIELLKIITINAGVLGTIAILINSARTTRKLEIAHEQTAKRLDDTNDQIRKTRHDIKDDLQAQSLVINEVAERTNGGLTRAVQEVGEQVRIAEREQLINNPACMKLVTEAIEKAADLAADKAEERMRRVIEEMKRGTGQ